MCSMNYQSVFFSTVQNILALSFYLPTCVNTIFHNRVVLLYELVVEQYSSDEVDNDKDQEYGRHSLAGNGLGHLHVPLAAGDQVVVVLVPCTNLNLGSIMSSLYIKFNHNLLNLKPVHSLK